MSESLSPKTEKIYGIDLSGSSTKKTAVVMATTDGGCHVTLTIIRDHPLKKTDEKESKKYFKEILRDSSKVYIDAPMDVQGLPYIRNIFHSCGYTWQFTKRPVDQAYNGLPPFADKIGAIVTRLMYYLYDENQDHAVPIYRGFEKYKNLYETYPAGTLRQLGIYQNYKNGRVILDSNGWHPEDAENHHVALCGLANALFRNAGTRDTLKITEDEFDAMICAVTGLLDDGSKLTGNALQQEIHNRLRKKKYKLGLRDCLPPTRYELINDLSKIHGWKFTVLEG